MIKKTTMLAGVGIAFIFGIFIGYTVAAVSGDSSSQKGTKTVVSAQNTPAPNNAERLRLENAVQANSKSPEAWNKLGHWYFDNNLPEDAVRAYESSLILKPGDPDILTDLGVMYRNLHNHDKALETFRKASAANPKHGQSRFNQGIVLYFDFDRKAEGLAVWNDLLKIYPNYTAPNGQLLSSWIKEL